MPVEAVAAQPVADAEFAGWMAALGPFSAERRVAVAVSGGADSLCLAWLAARWGLPLAFIVDHGLRPDSAEETAVTARRLGGFGVPSRVLRLHLRAGPGLQERARQARYAALTEAARAEGLIDLLLGHHAEDQRETWRMRQAAGSGPLGLAGMARIAERAWLRRLRPLLSVPPDRLRATLQAAGLGWVEDPSNRDPRWLRARLRAEPATACAGTESAGPERIAAEAGIAAWLGARATIRPEGFAILSPGAIEPEGLSALIRALSGAAYPPATRAVQRLAASPRPATLGGVRLLAAGRLGPGFLLVREEAALAPPVTARPGTVWDRRFRLEGAVPEGLHLGALGRAAGPWGRTGLPASVRRSLPALWQQGTLAAVPHLGYHRNQRTVELSLIFHPALPASGAAFAR